MVQYNLEELYNGSMIVCPKCKGKGEAKYQKFSRIHGYYDHLETCRDCKGKGLVKIKLISITEGE